MVNLDSITLEDIKEQHKSIDPKIREIIDSELFTDRVSEISDLYNFDIDDTENLAFHKLVGITALGFIRSDELPDAILMFVKTDKETAMAAAEEVKKILPIPSPAATITPVVMAGLPPKQDPASVPIQTSPMPVASTTPEPIRSGFGPGRGGVPIQPEQSSAAESRIHDLSAPPAGGGQIGTPFVIHENEEVRSNVTMDTEARGTVRPVFYKPVFAPKKPADYASPSPVRVDMGNADGVNPQAVPKTVNYTVRTPQAQPQTAPTNPPPKVDPENVVDLKDLPK